MKTIMNYIPLFLLISFLITCNNLQPSLYDQEAMEVGGWINHEVYVPQEAKINQEVLILIDLNLQNEKGLKNIELEMWRIDDSQTAHQRLEVNKKMNDQYYYKMYFDYPGVYQIRAHIWADGIKRIINKTITITT